MLSGRLSKLVVCTALVMGLGCAGSGQKAAGIQQLDELLGRVERVHLESELCHQRAGTAIKALQVVLSGQGQADLATTFAELQTAARASEEQSYRLRAATGPLKAAGEAHFARWTNDLSSFSSPALRQRSQERMDSARANLDAVLMALAPAQASLEVYNKSIKDLTLFLGNDLSSASVAAIEPDVHGLVDQAIGVDQKLLLTLQACKRYVETHSPAAGLQGNVAEAPQQPEAKGLMEAPSSSKPGQAGR
jgi:Protein of unknown function (DUF2959)